ncbi:hypothetical protein CO709_19720 [Burkholderia thailandensis]|nr:hypothetical protein CO709_19720 [Burkholderia thailandensis]
MSSGAHRNGAGQGAFRVVRATENTHLTTIIERQKFTNFSHHEPAFHTDFCRV